ncbi:hypothetical protein [Rickettsia endosymbiont of Ceutorhynchus obstrictus]|uniref:hypothetical protein n=1 Tax=Rickettsia endosymbiont of Ceutorhynchus obstrictus TaxID=3066249 RepID=UPI003132A466
MFGKYLQVYIPDLPEHKSIIDIAGSSKMDVWRAAAHQAYDDSPSLSSVFNPENIEYFTGLQLRSMRILVSDDYSYEKKITQEEFEAKYKDTRLKYDPNFTEDEIKSILEKDKQREINEYIISRGKGGLVEAIGKFGVEIVASNLSPINIAASFVPIGGQARWAAAALKYGALKTTLAKGVVGGAAGQVFLEPITHYERNREQREYGLKDSVVNILQSGLFGGALHGLGYSAKYLKNRYFVTSETLAPEVKTDHPIVDSQFKENTLAVLAESDPQQLATEPHNTESYNLDSNNSALNDSTTLSPVPILAKLQAAKLKLIGKAEKQFPQYFNQYKKLATLEQSLHEQFYTGNKTEKLPKHLKKSLQQEKAKLKTLKEQYINRPEFQKYLTEEKKLNNRIKVNLRKEQYELRAYDLSPENLYIARNQINEGKHINLDNPHEAVSIYEGDGSVEGERTARKTRKKRGAEEETTIDNATNTEIASLAEQVASLKDEVANLPEEHKASYKEELITEEQIEKLVGEVINRIKKRGNEKSLAALLNTLSIVDKELVGKLKTLHKDYTGNRKLALLERNKEIDMFVSDFKEKSFLRKRDNALKLIKQAEGESFIRRFVNKTRGTLEYLRQVCLRQVAVEREFLYGLLRDLEQAGLTADFSNKKYEADIVQELWNITHPNKKDTRSYRAKDIASIIYKWQMKAINRANLAGAYIIPYEGYITRRTHDAKKLLEAGFEKWLKFIEPLLDREKTGKVDFRKIYNNLATETHLNDVDEYLVFTFKRDKGKNKNSTKDNIADMTPEDRKLHFKNEQWKAELSFKSNKTANKSGGIGNVANKVSACRKLHFKTAEAELKYLYEFGNYSPPNVVDKVLNPLIPTKSFIAESIVSNLSKLSKSIGILETMGSNPQEMLNTLRETATGELQAAATKNAGKLQAASTKNTAIFKDLEGLKGNSKFDNQLALMLGVRSEVPRVDRILGAYRAWKCISNLGSTVISSFADAATFVAELQNNGIPFLESYRNIIQVFSSSFNPKQKKEFGMLLGVGVDSLFGGIYSRLSGEGEVAGSITKLMNAFFKLNCMEWWDNAWKGAVANVLSHNLAMELSVEKPFRALYTGLQTLLERYNINENNWHLYKELIQTVEGKKYLIPDVNLLNSLPDKLINAHLILEGKGINELNRTRFKQNITNNLRRYLIDRVDTAIPTPHTAERNAVQLGNLGIQQGTPIAAVVKCLMQFKTFAYTYAARSLKAATIDQIPIHEQRGYGLFDKGTWQDLGKSLENPTTLKILSQLLMGTTGLGYLSINAGRLLRGQELLAPNDEGAFTASVLKGGGLGIYGDFLFGEYNRYNHNLLQELAGPFGGDLIDFGKLSVMAKSGDPKAQELLTRTLKRNIPGRNLFYLLPALFAIEKMSK